ncbi:12320_t:CDS:2, partial [Ambispora gerdemannii]
MLLICNDFVVTSLPIKRDCYWSLCGQETGYGTWVPGETGIVNFGIPNAGITNASPILPLNINNS